MNNNKEKTKVDKLKAPRGLAAANSETRLRVASMGGKSAHETRGLQNSNSDTRFKVAQLGGKASGKNRTLAKLERDKNKNV